MSFTEEEKQVLREEYLYDVHKDASVWLPVEYLKAIAQHCASATSMFPSLWQPSRKCWSCTSPRFGHLQASASMIRPPRAVKGARAGTPAPLFKPSTLH